MVKYVATLILIGLASVMLCGFFVIGPANHAMNHAGSNTLEHHFSMWSDISTALISILVLAYFVVRNFNFTQPLLSIQLACNRIPIERDKGLSKRTKLTRWLSLFENSPSYA